MEAAEYMHQRHSNLYAILHVALRLVLHLNMLCLCAYCTSISTITPCAAMQNRKETGKESLDFPVPSSRELDKMPGQVWVRSTNCV